MVAENFRMFQKLRCHSATTEFFRAEDGFRQLSKQAIEPLVNESGSRRPIRVWVPGCSTGEEAFSIAMAIQEAGIAAQQSVTAQVFATDIHRGALETASKGTFQEQHLRSVPPIYRKRYFKLSGEDEYRIIPTLRKWVVFASHNLLNDPPFTKIDLVSCRNMLIYLDGPAQSRALSLLHFALNQGGYLFLGPSESLGTQADEFETLNGRWRLFRKHGSRHGALAPDGVMETGHLRQRHGWVAPLRSAIAKPREQSLIPAYTALLEGFVPAGALINAERELLLRRSHAVDGSYSKCRALTCR